jgi:hypothetical protein
MKVTWTSSAKGTLVSYLEVTGGYLFSLPELIAVKPPNQTWTTAQLRRDANDGGAGDRG